MKISILIAVLCCTAALASCPLDHLAIGHENMRLIVDSTQKYRHSDGTGEPTWAYWHYPMYWNARFTRWGVGEPGFDLIGNDPQRQLVGTPNVDYRIIVQCLDIAPGFSAVSSANGISITAPGDSFNHSALWDPHVHIEYRSPELRMGWVTFWLYDELGMYQPSDPFTIVFVEDAPPGDLVVDGLVDMRDLAQFTRYWLGDKADRSNDWYERADINRDGIVNFLDLAILAEQYASPE